MLAIIRVRKMIQDHDQGYDQLAYEWSLQNKYDLRKEVKEWGMLEMVRIVGLIFVVLPVLSFCDIKKNMIHVTLSIWFTICSSSILGLFVLISCTGELLKMNRKCKAFLRWNEKREGR